MPPKSSRLVNEKPLQGAQICCTAIPQEEREELAKWAEDMGAEHTLDLTSDVTHLIVGMTQSEKYQYVAREREDVKVLLPTFLHGLRDLWTRDEPIDMNQLEVDHRCRTFHGLVLCLTGFQDPHFRAQIEEQIIMLGGTYSGDLHRQCTHLIAMAATGEKYKHATAWGLKVVSLKWFKESIDRGMQLNENKYHPSMHPAEQGKGAWHRQPIHSMVPGKRPRQEAPEPASRKLRRTASARLGSQHVEIWKDIVRPTSLPQDETPDGQAARLRSSKSMPEMQARTAASTTAESLQPGAVNDWSRHQALLAGRHVAARGFEGKRLDMLINILKGHGATTYDSISELSELTLREGQSRLVVVPHETLASQLAIVKQKCTKIVIVTEFWLEWCISSKRFVEPEQYPLGWPLTAIDLVPAKQLTINASGFPQRQLLHISKLVPKVGAEYHETFTRRTKLLICHSDNLNREKLEHARKWNMLVVSQKWLWQLMRTGRLPPLEPYALLPIKPRIPSGKQGPDLGAQTAMPQSDHATAKEAPALLKDNVTSQQKRTDSRPTSKSANSKPLIERDINLGDEKLITAKKKLFRTFDGQDDGRTAQAARHDVIVIDDPSPSNSAVDPHSHAPESGHAARSHEEIINELLIVKAEAAARKAAAESQSPTKPKSRKLIGRAVSNLSNASRHSEQSLQKTTKPLSRASSIASNNTDGLGVPLSAMSRIPSDLKGRPTPQQPRGEPSQDKETIVRVNQVEESRQPPTPEMCVSNGMTYEDFHAALTTLSMSQLPLPPGPTPEPQMGYADSEESIELKAKLAEMRRKRLQAVQESKGLEPTLEREDSEEMRQRMAMNAIKYPETDQEIIRDDEALVGQGRRTRGREKALNALMHRKDTEVIVNGYF